MHFFRRNKCIATFGIAYWLEASLHSLMKIIDQTCMQTIISLWHKAESVLRAVIGERESEMEQASIRVLIGLAALIYFSRTLFPGNLDSLGFHLDPICVLLGFVVIAAALMICVLLWPGEKPVRRVTGIVLDVGTLTYLFIISESRAAPLFFLYQWIIIGYGFRFGTKYLFVALGMSLLGFGLVIILVPYWYEELGLSLGLWFGTLLISLYFSAFVSRLRNALSHAEESNQAKRTFICSVSHELRTPLNAIIGMVDLLKSTALDHEQREILNSMTNTSKVMLSQIEDVLDFSKIEAGKMSVERTSFDLYQLVQGIQDIFSYQIDLFQIELSHSIAQDVPYRVEGDPHHLRQILVNLIGNAVKFTEQGNISVRIKKTGETESRVRLRFQIKDTGIGISEAAKAKIFESFTQADESTARRFGGTGLGTTICKQLVELMNGSIGFDSTQGKGSTFWFELEFGIPEQTFQDTVESFKAIRTLIISPIRAHEALVECVVDLSGRAPELVRSTAEATTSMEKALLTGQPIRLVFLDLPREQSQSAAEYASTLSKEAEALRKASPHSKLTLVLLTDDQQMAEDLDSLMDVAKIYSILTEPPTTDSCRNLLHANAIDLNRSKAHAVSGESASTPMPATPVSMTSPELSGYDLLVAEDNPTNRKVLQKILERAGHRCSLVRDGEEALDAVDKHIFDAIILDMNMPVLAGTDVARLCRLMHGQSARIPIIMFSANVTTEARQESIEAGADEFLPKPIQIDVFLKTLNRLVEAFHQYQTSSGIRNVVTLPCPLLWGDDEVVLNPQALTGIENMSTDPRFLDDLIVEFINENRRMLDELERSMLAQDLETFREIIHALKGSALSVGAVAMKMACKRMEKLDPPVIASYSQEIMQQLRQIFMLLCEELEKYRQKRVQRYCE